MPQIIDTPHPITAAQFTVIDTDTASIETILDIADVPLTVTQTKAIIRVSTVRSAEIDDTNNLIIEPFPKTVPASVDPLTFAINLLYINSLKTRQSMLVTQAGKMQTLIDVAENNAMVDVNLILNNARLLAKGDKNLKTAMDKITVKYFSKKAKKVATGYLIVKAGVMTISKVVTKKKFTNNKPAILSILQVGTDISLTIIVQPFTSVDIPVGWTNIVVTNLSDTTDGGFTVFVK